MRVAPVIGVATVDDLLAQLHAVDQILAGPEERHGVGFLEVPFVLFKVGLGKDRQTAHRGRQIAEGLARNKGEFHLVGVQHFHRLDLFVKDRPKLGDALFGHHIVAEHHVFGGQGRSVREFHILAQIEDHPGTVGGIFHRLAHVAITGADLVGGAGQDRLVHHRHQRRRDALNRIGVQRIVGAKGPLAELAALGRVRVHIVEMGQVGGIFQIAKGRDAVADDHFLRTPLSGQEASRDQQPCRQRLCQTRSFNRFCLSGAAS